MGVWLYEVLFNSKPSRPAPPPPPSLDPKVGEYAVGDQMRVLVSYKGQLRTHLHFFTQDNINWTLGELSSSIATGLVQFEVPSTGVLMTFLTG